MLIGVPTEIKQDEHRVGLTPTSVRELTFHGHQVLVQSKAGAGIGVRRFARICFAARGISRA